MLGQNILLEDILRISKFHQFHHFRLCSYLTSAKSYLDHADVPTLLLFNRTGHMLANAKMISIESTDRFRKSDGDGYFDVCSRDRKLLLCVPLK